MNLSNAFFFSFFLFFYRNKYFSTVTRKIIIQLFYAKERIALLVTSIVRIKLNIILKHFKSM